MAKGDTRRKAAGGIYNRETGKYPNYMKEITDTEDMCLLTEVRDNGGAYEGFNLITECKAAKTGSASAPGNQDGNYGEPIVSAAVKKLIKITKIS